MLSLFQYSAVEPVRRRNVPGPPTRLLTSPPPSSGGGKPGFKAGSGRSVVYLNQGGRVGGRADQSGFSCPVVRSKNSPSAAVRPEAGTAAVQGRWKEGRSTLPSARTAA